MHEKAVFAEHSLDTRKSGGFQHDSNAHPCSTSISARPRDAIRDTVHYFASHEIAPRAADIDKTNQFPRDLWPKLWRTLAARITVEEEWRGGARLPRHCHRGRGDRAHRPRSPVYGAHSNLLRQSDPPATASAAQNANNLPGLDFGEHARLIGDVRHAGSDVVSMTTRADKKGDRYVLNGSKKCGSPTDRSRNARGLRQDRSERRLRGITAFIIEKGMKGFPPRRSWTSSHARLRHRRTGVRELRGA